MCTRIGTYFMVSVVIPAHNEEKLIASSLEGLVRQKTDQPFEVIVVDNDSTDRTKEIALQYAQKLNLRVVHQRIKGRGAARLMGFEKAKGDIIMSTDADAVVPPNWIENLSRSLISSNAVAVSGTSKIKDCDLLTNLSFNLSQPFFNVSYRIMMGHFWLSGFNFAVYKEAYQKSGGFNPRLNALEDTDLAFKVSRVGKIKYINNLPVLMSGRRFRKKPLKQTFSYVTTFIGYFVRNKKDIIMPDIR